MRLSAFCMIASAFLIVGCASAPKSAPASAPAPIAIKDETAQYSFIYEAPANVVSIPGLAETLNQEAAKARAQQQADNLEFRATMQDDPRDIQLAYEALWSRGADAGALTSVRMDFYGYGGGAHPITDFDGRLFEKASGKRLMLADLLTKPVAQTGLPDALCQAIAAEKKARDMPFNDAGDPIACKGPDANVPFDGPLVFAASTAPGKSAGLRFLFGPYVLGAYVEGPYVIDVPAAAFLADIKAEYAAGFGGDFDPNDPKDPAADMPYIGGGDR
ncbi:MAG: hypothetical protein ABWZ40_06860 [Caulobacterales bacterium]